MLQRCGRRVCKEHDAFLLCASLCVLQEQLGAGGLACAAARWMGAASCFEWCVQGGLVFTVSAGLGVACAGVGGRSHEKGSCSRSFFCPHWSYHDAVVPCDRLVKDGLGLHTEEPLL